MLFLRMGGVFLFRIVVAGLENPAYPKVYPGLIVVKVNKRANCVRVNLGWQNNDE